MERAELYEHLRVLLNAGAVLPLPKHEATYNLLTNMFDEEEAAITVAGLQKVNTPVSLDDILNASDLSRDRLTDRLEAMVYKGLIRKPSPEKFMAVPYYLGIIPRYFIYNRVDPESMKMVSEATSGLLRSSWAQEMSDWKLGLTRVMPAVKPTEKTISINKAIEVEKTVLPYEILKEYISKVEPQSFRIIPCGCRELARLSGNPCQRTNENFCISIGAGTAAFQAQGIGRAVSLDELMEVLERAEKEGLVHQTGNIQETAALICNCCSCCCAYLKPFKETRGAARTIARSNFEPVYNNELCELSETCAQICPTGAIFHHHPHKPDGTDDYMMIRPELCMGCGLCASNCPNEAITMRKVRDVEPPKNAVEMAAKFIQGRTH